MSDSGQVTVEVYGRADTTPALISLPPRDAYVMIKVRVGGRVVLAQKIEVRRNHETLVRLRYTAPRPHHPRYRPAEYIGSVWNNTQYCGVNDRATYKYSFLRNGRPYKDFIVNMAKYQPNVTMPAGHYKVRIFKKHANGGFIYHQTGEININKDGWKYQFGCSPPKAPPRPTTFNFQFRNCTGFVIRYVVPGLGTYTVNPRSTWTARFNMNQRRAYRARIYIFRTTYRGGRYYPSGYLNFTLQPNGWVAQGCR